MIYELNDCSANEIPYKEILVQCYMDFEYVELTVRKYPKRYFLAYSQNDLTISEMFEVHHEPDVIIFDKVPHKELTLKHIQNFVIASNVEDVDPVELFNLIAKMEKLFDDYWLYVENRDHWEWYDNGGHPDNFGDN